jgi:hypothetical protein
MKKYVLWALMVFACAACENSDVKPHENQVTDGDANASYQAFYLLSEGTMGANKATLDYFNYTTGLYENDVFPKRNPSIIDELGDTGTSLAVYGGKMYAIINGSNLVEIMDAKTAIHLASVTIPNVRNMAFDGEKVYFSSFAGPMQMGGSQLGYVVEMDTTTFALGRTVTVGRQPEEMVVKEGKLYVANSGGYTPENYDNTVSVVDLATFTEIEKIPVAINLHRMFMASNGAVYVSSRGNYADVPANLYLLDTHTKQATPLGKGVTAYAIKDDLAYVIDITYGPAPLYQTVYSYYTLHLLTGQVDEQSFVSDAVKNQIVYPYAVAVHPVTGDILLTDAADFVTPGTLFYCNAQGNLLWKHTTGEVPAAVAFVK